jgi:hypothetical protein
MLGTGVLQVTIFDMEELGGQYKVVGFLLGSAGKEGGKGEEGRNIPPPTLTEHYSPPVQVAFATNDAKTTFCFGLLVPPLFWPHIRLK